MTLDEATRALAAAGIDNPRMRGAAASVAHALGISRDRHLTVREISPEQAIWFRNLVERRAVREPFAYITGHQEFWSMDFEVGPGVLVPRPDTETLIEEALRLVPDRTAPLTIADLGTGSGAILIAALKEFPNATGIGFEFLAGRFRMGPRQCPPADAARAEIRLADWNTRKVPSIWFSPTRLTLPPAISNRWTPMSPVSSPMQPWMGGLTGLSAYRALSELLPGLLKPEGHAMLEIGFGQAPAMEKLFPNLEIVRIAPDLSGIPRCVILRKA